MTLVDKQIRNLIDTKVLEDADPERIGAVSYDLRTDYFAKDKGSYPEDCDLSPGESIFVACREVIHLPASLIARVSLRNSRIRQGLQLDAPVYYPGHKTRVFFRVTNISETTIRLSREDNGIASIMFEQLAQEPEHPYDGTFQDENLFAGMGNYEKKYKLNMKEVEEKAESIRNMERNLYSTVITIMSVFIALFSIINVNIDLAYAQSADAHRMLVFNLMTIGSISFLISILRFATGKRKDVMSKVLLVLSIIILVAATVIALR